jgi:site-specific DNA-methyltransferase (adenine-specific)
MGKEWDGGDIAFRPETWELALKLLKPGGHLLAFSASRNYHRMTVAIEDAGFEIRDQLMWLYGSGFPKSHNLGDGWGTALKPAHEPIVMARKPISEKSIVDNVLKHGTGAINIDGCRIEGNDAKYPDTNPDFRDQGKKSKEAIGIDKLSFGQVSGAERKKVVRKSRSEDGVWTDGNSGMKAEGTQYADADPRGRFPANVMHDGLQTEWARYFYCPKTSKSERHSNLDDHETKVGVNGNKWTDQDYRRGDTKPTTERKNTHPTVKPVDLMRYLCRMVTPKGGTVLDPFMGSGSTGMAAKDEGFDFIGIEKEKEYFEICESRIKRFAPLMDFM